MTAKRAPSYDLLIVEDDEIDRLHYGRMLARNRPFAAHIRLAASAAAGIAALAEQTPDCILLDYSLPDMNGLEFLAEIERDGDLPCAIVLVTGRGNETVAVEAMKRGVQDYLVKDHLNEAQLREAITHAISQAALRRQLAAPLRALTVANAALEREVEMRRAAEADLTTAKNAAEQANRAKTRFITMVTHELRTPLNGILGYAQLLRIEGGLSARQGARVEAMLHAGRHLLDMVEGVLDFASIEAGRMVLNRLSVSVRELAEGCMEALGPVAAEKGLSLTLAVHEDAPVKIIADPARLRQVLLNLLGNAVKYTNEGSVELRLLPGAEAGGVRIEVADTGPGIDAESHDHLFEDFERGAASLAVEGAGLGLAIAARIVGLLGGTLGHQDNPGGGSLFWIELKPHMSAAEPVAPAGEGSLPPRSARRALLVDDIAMNRDVIGSFLGAAGYAVALAKDGQEAVRLASEQKFDLILMDVRMPKMDGLEATRRIRALPPPRGLVPILALTAHSLLDQATRCLEAGMDGFITKPVDYASMMRAIEDAIGQTSPRWAQIPAGRAVTQPPPAEERVGLAQTLALLPSDEAAATLRSLRLRTVQLMDMLEQEAEPHRLQQTAQALACVADMFGFDALAAASREFERVALEETPQTEPVIEALRANTGAAIATMDALRRELRLEEVKEGVLF